MDVINVKNAQLISDKLDATDMIMLNKVNKYKTHIKYVSDLVNSSVNHLYVTLNNLNTHKHVNKDISNKCYIYEDPMNEIYRNLFLGDNESSYDAGLLRKHKIKHIIRVMPEFDKTKIYNGVKYVHIPIKDEEVCSLNLNKMFDYTSDYIANCIKNNEAVLVHCKRGHHRSATVVAAFLVKHLHMKVEAASRLISSFRPCALRREVCMIDALKLYEKYI